MIQVTMFKFTKKTVFRQLYILTLLMCFEGAFCQCQQVNSSFSEGELLEYEVYYNWGFIWLNAGWVNFQVKPAVYKEKEVYHFEATGESHKSYDWIYKVRDKYQAYMGKDNFRPVWFHRLNSEGNFKVNNKYFFNWDKNIVYSFTENSDKPLEIDTLPVPECTYDVLSLVYYVRNLDFSNLNFNDTLPIISIIDKEVFNLYIRYLGKEVIKNKEGEKYNCIKFSALLVEGTIFKGGEDLVVWVTDDANKIPILVEAKIVVGSIKVYLKTYTGLVHQIEVIN